MSSDEIEWNEKEEEEKNTHQEKRIKFLRVSFISFLFEKKRSQIYNSRLVGQSQCVFFCLYVTILLCWHLFVSSHQRKCACVCDRIH